MKPKVEQSVIGGEFEYDISFLKKENEYSNKECFYYSSGRAALYHIFLYAKEKLNKKIVYLPDYLCETIINIAFTANIEIRYYPILPTFLPDMTFFEKVNLDNAIVLIINYFGGLKLKDAILRLREIESTSCLVEDNVQAFAVTGNGADFSFTSFRKYLPVPDGAWIKSKYTDLTKCSKINTFVPYKVAGSLMKSLRNFDCVEDSFYLSLLQKGEMLIDENLNAMMSDISFHALQKLNMTDLREHRKSNATYLINELKKIKISPLIVFEEDTIPLFIPIFLENRDEVRKRLSQENIFCPVHWPCSNPELKKGMEMMKYELSLVIDHRYNWGDMARIIECIRKYHGN